MFLISDTKFLYIFYQIELLVQTCFFVMENTKTFKATEINKLITGVGSIRDEKSKV